MSTSTLVGILIGFWLLLQINCLMNNEIEFDQFFINDINEKFAKNVRGRIERYNRTSYVFNLNFTLVLPMDYKINVEFSLLARQGNEYRTIFTIPADDCCAYMMQSPFYEDIAKTSNLPNRECPITVGDYYIKHLKMNTKPPTILLTYEFWRMDMITRNKADGTLCSDISVTFKIAKKLM